MGLKYAFFHWLVHLLLACIIIYFYPNLTDALFILFFTVAIDIDHFYLIKKYGFFGTLWLRAVIEFKKPRRYVLHNIKFIIFSLIALLLSFYYKIKFFQIMFASFLFHMIWDLFEDVIIFKIGIKCWI